MISWQIMPFALSGQYYQFYSKPGTIATYLGIRCFRDELHSVPSAACVTYCVRMKLLVKDKPAGPVQLMQFHVDVELCGLLVALYRYGCKNACWVVPKDLVAIAKDFGLLYDASSNDTNPPTTPISGKTTSVIAIIGIGGWLFYRWLKTKRAPKFTKLKSLADYNEGIRARFSLFGRPNHTKSTYFGPKNPPEYKEDKNKSTNNRYNHTRNSARDMMSSDSDWSPIHIKEHKRKMRKRMCRGWPLFCKKSNNYDEWSNSRDSAEISFNSSPGNNHSLKREESLDSISSDFSMGSSMDIPSNFDSNITAKMDQLQEEIEQLKNSCLSMDEEFETIKTNRNLPGLANLMTSNESDAVESKESAKACFKGLYSLTTINRSMSFDFSMSQCDSIDEDSPYNMMSPTGESSLEWDTLDSLDMVSTNDLESSDLSKNEYEFNSSTNINKLNKGLIGPLIPLSSYCIDSNNSLVPQHILKSLLDISNKKYQFVGFVQDDSNNLLRSTLFIMLSKNIPLPNSGAATSIIKEAYHRNPTLFHCWNFNGLNSYSSNKLKGINSCLNSLDKLISGIKNPIGVLDQLMSWINTDPILDSHAVEAIKLHIAAKIFSSENMVDSFYKKFCPLLSKDLALSDRIEILINFTNDINSPENTGSVIGCSNEAIIYLISQTFGIIIEVLKPSAFNTENYLQRYPDFAPDNWPSILLLSEDNKHFQIVI